MVLCTMYYGTPHYCNVRRDYVDTKHGIAPRAKSQEPLSQLATIDILYVTDFSFPVAVSLSLSLGLGVNHENFFFWY